MDLESRLKTIADHAWWMRDEKWSRAWWESFFCPLVREGLFLPPLLAYDIRSSADRGEHRRGPASLRRKHSSEWGSFLLWAQRVTLGCLSTKDLASIEARSRSGRRIARLLAANIMDRVDLSGLRENGDFSPLRCLSAETAWLSGAEDPVMKEVWALIENFVLTRTVRGMGRGRQEGAPSEDLSGRYSELASIADSIPFVGRTGEDLDLFVPRLLSEPFPSTAFDEPQISGWEPRADNPRVALSPTGEFAQRDTGGVPGELARLAPSELLLLQQANSGAGGDSTEGKRSREDRFRTLFLFRATRRELLQRFSQANRPSLMEPSMLLQVDLFDELELHRLSDPPFPPLISWYRATLVELIHLFSRLAKPFRWTIRFNLNHFCERGRTNRRLYKPDLEELGQSPESCFSSLVWQMPGLFTNRSCLAREPVKPDDGPFEADLWLRIVLGDPKRFIGRNEAQDSILTNQEAGARIERLRNGSFGIKCCGSALEAHLIELDFSHEPAPPAVAAWELVGQTLNLVEETRN